MRLNLLAFIKRKEPFLVFYGFTPRNVHFFVIVAEFLSHRTLGIVTNIEKHNTICLLVGLQYDISSILHKETYCGAVLLHGI